MPRITSQSNGSVVNPNIANPRINNNNIDIQAEAQSRGNIGRGLGQIAGALIKGEQEDDNNRRLEAQNEYDRQITELKSDIKTNWRLANSEGAADYFREQSNRIRQDVYGKSGIKYRNTEEMFNIQTDRSNISDLDDIYNFEVSEKDKNFEIQLDNTIRSTINKGIQNKGNIEDVILARNSLVTDIEEQGARFGKDYVDSKKAEAVSELVNGAIQYRAALKDYDGALQLLNKFRGDIDDRKFVQISAILGEQQRDDFTYTLVSNIRKQRGDNLTPQELDEIVLKESVPNSIRGNNNISKEQFYVIVSGQETGGREDAYQTANGTGSGAFGKYQIMPGNWDNWSREAGISGASITDPQAQETVARYKLGQYYDEFGAEGALVAWYAGPVNGARWRDGKPDAIGDNGQHYSWDMVQSGQYAGPSVRGYVQEALGVDHAEPGKSSQLATTEYIKPSRDYIESVKAQYYKDVQLDQTIAKENKAQFYENQQNSFLVKTDEFMATNPSAAQIVTYYQQNMNEIKQMTYGDYDGRNLMMGTLNSWMNSVSGNEEMTPQAEDVFLNEVASMKYKTKEELNAYMTSARVPFSSQKKALDLFNKTSTSEANNYDWKNVRAGTAVLLGWSDKDMKDPERERQMNAAERMTKDYISTYTKEKGYPPTQLEVQDNMKKTLTPQLFVGGNTNWIQRIGGDYEIEFTPAELSAANIARVEVLEQDAQGNQAKNYYMVTFTNGRTQPVRGDRLEAFVKEGQVLE